MDRRWKVSRFPGAGFSLEHNDAANDGFLAVGVVAVDGGLGGQSQTAASCHGPDSSADGFQFCLQSAPTATDDHMLSVLGPHAVCSGTTHTC